MLGKLDPDDLARVLTRTGARDDSVLTGPTYGEDAAAMRLDDGSVLVANSDPLSLAKERLGTLAVHVACNDVAACGADPRWLTNVMFLPDDEGTLDALTTQMDEEARELGVAIVGGHSEYAPALERPMVSMTALGLTDEYVPTGGAEPGDRLVLTKGAGIEGTAVLATDFRDDLDLPADVLERAEGFFGDISVVPDARILRERAAAMHDPTEGGLVTGLVELASASGVRLAVDRSAVPVREETERICEAMGVDPLRIFGSGALLAAVPDGDCDDALAALDDEGIAASEIGVVGEATDDPGVELDGELVTEAVRDDLYDLWE